MRQQGLEPLLEIAAVLGAGHQGAQVQRIEGGIGQHLGNVALDHLLGQSLGDGGLADPGLADIEGVVLAPPAQHLDGAFQFVLAPDQGIDAPLAGLLVEVGGEVIQRGAAGGFAADLVLAAGGRRVFVVGHFGDPVRDVVDHVQAADVLLLEQVDRL